MAMAEYLGNNGAQHLILTSKRGVTTGNQQAGLQGLIDQGINVRAPTPRLYVGLHACQCSIAHAMT